MKEALNKIDENTWIISDTHFGHGDSSKGVLLFEPCRLTQMRIDGYNADEHDQWIIDKWNNTVKPGDTVLHLGDFSFKSGSYKKEFNNIFEKKYKKVLYKELKLKLKLLKPKTLKEIEGFIVTENPSKGMSKEQFKSLLDKYIPENEYFIRPEDVLNGNIILVLGNHDKKPKQYCNRNIEVVSGFYHFTGDILNKVQNKDTMLSGFIKDINGKKCMFTHYALFNNDERDLKNKMIAPRIKVLEKIYESLECKYNIHGHLHSNKSVFRNSINVSFEQIGFCPRKLKDYI